MFGLGFNKEKSRANAEKYLQQNKLQNAINEYEKILAAEPNDLNVANTVGDIYSRLGQNEKAIERFRQVAEAYASQGLTLKSIAMYRKIVKLDANDLASMEKLAELYRKQGLVTDARSMLLQAADAYTRKNQPKETLRLLKQLVLFDPENVQVITRTADLLNGSGQKAEAQQMLSQSATTLINRQAFAPAQKVLERLLTLDRGNLRAQELRAQVTLELGDTAKAIEYYEGIADLDSRSDALRNLLAAYLSLGKNEDAMPIARKLVTVHQDPSGIVKLAGRLYEANDYLGALALYNEFSGSVFNYEKEEVLSHLHGIIGRVRENPDALQTLYDLFRRAAENSSLGELLELLAHACVQQNQLDRARKAYKELIELEPGNPSHVQGYRQVCARLDAGGQGSAVAEPPTALKGDSPKSLEDFMEADEPALPRQKYTPMVEDQIAAALSEAELCESYASKARGIHALELALESAPDDLQLNRMLALLYRQENQPARAADCYTTMQRVLEHMGEMEAAGYYANLIGADQTTTWEASGSEFSAGDFATAPKAEEGTTAAEEIDLSGEWDSVWQETGGAAPEPEPAPVAPAPAAPVPANIAELVEEVRFCLAQQFWSEAESGIARIAALAPAYAELALFRDQLAKGRTGLYEQTPPEPAAVESTIEVIEVTDLPEADGYSAPVVPAMPAAAPTLNSLAAELDLELGDAFEPVAKPREPVPPARPAAPPPPPPPPARPAAPAPMAAASASVAPPPKATMPAPPVPHEEPTSSIFGNLLQEFESDLAGAQEDDGDPETHYNLGIAFREMGLLDEAIGELQKACRLEHGLKPAQLQHAYIWLATCFAEKSVPEASVKWYLRALEAATDEESRTAVNYELANAYEAAGRKREALDRFMEVYGSNIDYRDVASRIRELRQSL